MKNLKLGLWCLLVAFAASIFLTSCEQENVLLPDAELPDIVEQQLKTSQEIWNQAFSDKLTYVSHEYVADIKNESDKNKILISMADEAQLVASGNVQEPETVKVEVLDGTTDNAVKTRRNIRNYMADEVEVGNQVIAITWKRGDETHVTHCIANADGIVWDNVLGGVISVDPAGEESHSADTKSAWKSYRRWWTANWLWGSKRGEIGYKITIYYNGSYVSNTDRQDWGHITIGKAKSESKILKNSGNYGKIRYALGLCTPVGTLSFNHSNFTVSAGGIGSNIVRNGTKSLYP